MATTLTEDGGYALLGSTAQVARVGEIVIASGASLSNVLDLGAYRAQAILMPAAWTAADLSVRAGASEAQLGDMYTADDAEWRIASAQVVAGRYRLLDPVEFYGARFLQFRSGLSAAPVVQGAARTLYVIAG